MKKCGAIRRNKAAKDDNMDLIINLQQGIKKTVIKRRVKEY